MMEEHSFITPGKLVQSISPVILNIALFMQFYLLQSSVLTASLFQSLIISDLKNVCTTNCTVRRISLLPGFRLVIMKLILNTHLCLYI